MGKRINRKTIIGLKLATILCAYISAPADANYTCTGTVDGVLIDPKNGLVLAQKIGDLKYPVLCAIDSVKNGVSIETCKSIYSLLLTAQSSSKTVTLWFNDDGDCTSTTHLPWKELTGWYYGPRINNQ